MTSSPEKPDQDATADGLELLEDGQEEVFSQTAVARGFVKDPTALAEADEPDRPSEASP
ncbi:MAG: hypothetical protein ACK41C_05905 [Phenylobacterium sp.]|uniref:hypothetical protein n=1 Tax=Phenylobacterium sp. TaxID=1871053 RepID=UPI00391D095E